MGPVAFRIGAVYARRDFRGNPLVYQCVDIDGKEVLLSCVLSTRPTAVPRWMVVQAEWVDEWKEVKRMSDSIPVYVYGMKVQP